jgi:hypothetical protein
VRGAIYVRNNKYVVVRSLNQQAPDNPERIVAPLRTFRLPVGPYGVSSAVWSWDSCWLAAKRLYGPALQFSQPQGRPSYLLGNMHCGPEKLLVGSLQHTYCISYSPHAPVRDTVPTFESVRYSGDGMNLHNLSSLGLWCIRTRSRRRSLTNLSLPLPESRLPSSGAKGVSALRGH